MTAGVECTDRSRIRAAHAAASPAICTVFPAGMESRLKIFRCGIEFGVCIIRRRRPGDQFSSGSVSHIRSGGETGALARPPHPGAGRQAFDLVGTSNTRGAPFLRVLCAGMGFHNRRECMLSFEATEPTKYASTVSSHLSCTPITDTQPRLCENSPRVQHQEECPSPETVVDDL